MGLSCRESPGQMSHLCHQEALQRPVGLHVCLYKAGVCSSGEEVLTGSEGPGTHQQSLLPVRHTRQTNQTSLKLLSKPSHSHSP